MTMMLMAVDGLISDTAAAYTYLRPSRSLISRVERLWRTTAASTSSAVPSLPGADAEDADDNDAEDAAVDEEAPAEVTIVASNTSGRPPEKRDDDMDSDGDESKDEDDEEEEDSKPHARMSENCNPEYQTQTNRAGSHIEK